MPVTLTDTALALDAVLAVVGEVEVSADTMRVTVYLRDDALRD
jgi:predicted tellurium resistance membrane protein TerC